MGEPRKSLTLDERVELGAADGIYFGHEWFPRTLRQSSPNFHYEMMDEIESLENQFVGFEVFRDGAKTTLLRIAMAKRISYGITRTAVFSSAAQIHSERSVRWIKRQVQYNKYWTETFGLHKGDKWTDSELEIVSEQFGFSIFILAVGMTGQTRGINVEDYRPDFWLWDDVDNEETTGTEDQRKKQTSRFFGAMANTLAPLTENPHSKGALAQTPLHKQDILAQCREDNDWKVIKYGILDTQNKSRWEERHPTAMVLAKKANEISRGRIHIWKREKECLIVPSEGKAFNIENLRYYESEPEQMIVFIAIDPARDKVQNMKRAHKAAVVKIGVNASGIYLLDYYAAKGKNPDEIWTEFYRMAVRHPPRTVGVETVAYQRILVWYFRKKMREVNHYFAIHEIDDKRRKPDRIRQAHAIIDSRQFWVKRSHTEYIEALDDYSDELDIDVLDAGAMAITISSPVLLSLAEGASINPDAVNEDDFVLSLQENETAYPALGSIENCP